MLCNFVLASYYKLLVKKRKTKLVLEKHAFREVLSFQERFHLQRTNVKSSAENLIIYESFVLEIYL